MPHREPHGSTDLKPHRSALSGAVCRADSSPYIHAHSCANGGSNSRADAKPYHCAHSSTHTVPHTVSDNVTDAVSDSCVPCRDVPRRCSVRAVHRRAIQRCRKL